MDFFLLPLQLLLALSPFVLTGVQSANILYLSGSLSPGNHIWNRVIAVGLVGRGHNVTFLTAERDVSNIGLHFIHMENVYERIAQNHSHARQNHLQSKQFVFRRIKETYRLNNVISSIMARTAGVQSLLNYPKSFRFDAIIHDTSSAQALLGFWLHFNRPPLLAVSPSSVPFHLFSTTDIPFHPGPMLHPFSDYSSDLVLSTRVYNIIYYVFDRIYRSFPFMTTENVIARRLFGDELMTMDLESIELSTQLVLVNTNPAIDSSLILPQSVIPVGSLQLFRQGRVTNSIKQFLDASRNGVIVFSLGTGLLTPALKREEDEVFLEVFKHLYQYDFLWKYDKTAKLESPRNILMLDWLENQHLILQHPKVKLFITNGGPLSVQEAAWAGVPIIGIPMRFDQRQILMRMQKKGLAQLMPLYRLRNDTLFSLITDTIGNSSFKENAMEMAQLLRTHPDSAAISPVHRAVDWIEYALEHADLTHLRSPLASVPFQIVYSLDIVLAIAFTIIGFWVIVFKHMVYDKLLAQVRQQQQQASATSAESRSGALEILSDDTTAEGKQLMAAIAEVEEDIDTEDDVKEGRTGVVDKKNA